MARATVAQFVGGEPAADRICRAAAAASCRRQAPAAPLDPAANPAGAGAERRGGAGARPRCARWSGLTFPRFYLQGAAYARGTGAETNGANSGRTERPGAQRSELRAGLHRDVSGARPARDSRAREAAQAADVRAEEARYRQIATDLQRAAGIARVADAGWRAPGGRQHAGRGRGGARRHPAGRGALSVRLGRRSTRWRRRSGCWRRREIDEALARLGVWRALAGRWPRRRGTSGRSWRRGPMSAGR